MKELLKSFKLISILILTISLNSCTLSDQEEENIPDNEKKLIIFHAGSLSVPFKEIAGEFKRSYPDINIIMESAGSRSCARKITDLNKECDIMASADYTVIDNLLIPGHTKWNIKFASNEMTIVFCPESRFNEQINIDNWYDILLKDDVAFGRSDPDSDPCGYRAVLTIKLAEKFYNNKELSEKILNKDINYIRPKEVDLLSLLETNTIDYIFLYRSVAEQHGLKYLILPDEINLKSPELAGIYSKATIEVSGKKPGETIIKKGEPMVYGVTIPDNAPNREIAVKFLDFLLSGDKGMAIMEKNGQPSMVPSSTGTYKFIPEELKKYAKE